jgi:uncharacterized protein (TIGR02246 family)
MAQSPPYCQLLVIVQVFFASFRKFLTRTALTIAGLFIGFSGPARAQEKNTVDPQVRQQVEALNLKYDEAFNQNDAEAVAALFTADAVETGPEEAASSQEEIEDRYKILFKSHPNGHATKSMNTRTSSKDPAARQRSRTASPSWGSD